jgi:hypothetical protein
MGDIGAAAAVGAAVELGDHEDVEVAAAGEGLEAHGPVRQLGGGVHAVAGAGPHGVEVIEHHHRQIWIRRLGVLHHCADLLQGGGELGLVEELAHGLAIGPEALLEGLQQAA